MLLIFVEVFGAGVFIGRHGDGREESNGNDADDRRSMIWKWAMSGAAGRRAGGRKAAVAHVHVAAPLVAAESLRVCLSTGALLVCFMLRACMLNAHIDAG